jgi:hypothetical protein
MRIDAFDVYGPRPQGWVLDYSGDGITNIPTEIYASGSVAVFGTASTSGRVLYRVSSGVWTYLVTGITADTLGDTPVILIHSGSVILSYDKSTTPIYGQLADITSGAPVLLLGSTQLQGFSVTKDESNVYWMQKRTPTGDTGACYTGAGWEWNYIVGSPLLKQFSQATLSGQIFNQYALYSGSTGGVRTESVITGGIYDKPNYCYNPCAADGHAFAVGGHYYSGSTSRGFWQMDSFASGWVRKTGVVGGIGGCTSTNGKVYYGYISGLIIYVYSYDVASGVSTLEHSEACPVSYAGARIYCTNNGSSVFFAGGGHILRKDL